MRNVWIEVARWGGRGGSGRVREGDDRWRDGMIKDGVMGGGG